MNAEVNTAGPSQPMAGSSGYYKPQRWDFRLAKVISGVFSPPVVLVIAVVFIGVALNALSWSIIYVLSVIIVPTLYVWWLLKSGRIKNFHMYERRERIKPNALTLLLTILAWLGFKYTGAPPEFTLFAFVAIFEVAQLLLITFFWKISIHSTSITGLSFFLVALFGWKVWYLLLAIPLVIWARLRTDNHSFKQLLFGMLSGGGFIILVLAIISFQCHGAGLICE